jgi:hypothetical protein
MLLQQTAEPITSSGLGDGNNFTIAASAKAFDVLSSNLYQNKILAVIREISCNAADAHKLAGRPLSDIQIHIPTFSAPYFSVRDFGPGLSKPNVLNLYTTYFASSKDSNNDMIGGFGLGSKSPFAIADQFTVTSWHGDFKTTYVCYKQDGIPAINVISEEASDEPTGLEVRVAVQGTRFTTWEDEARGYYRWWPELPVSNLYSPPTYVLDPTNILVASSNVRPDGLPEWALMHNEHSKPRVFMGLVAYDLNLTAIPNLPEEIREGMSAMPLVFVLNVGDVSINPSRETLSYDPATCALLTTKLKSVYKDLLDDVNKKLAAEPTLYDARKFIFGNMQTGVNRSSLHDLLSRLIERGRLTVRWNNQPITKEVTWHTTLNSITLYEGRSYSSRWVSTTYGSGYSHNILYSSSHVVWVPAITVKTYSVLKHNSDMARLGTRKYIIISGGTFDDAEKEMFRIGWPPLIDGTKLEAPPRAAPGSRSAPTTRAYIIHGTSYDRSETVVDLKGGGYYCEFFDGRPQGIRFADVANLQQMKYLLADTRIVGFQKRRLTLRFVKALATNGWQPFDLATVLAATPDAAVKTFEYGWAMRVLEAARKPGISLLATMPLAHITCQKTLALAAVWKARPIITMWQSPGFSYVGSQLAASQAAIAEAKQFEFDLEAWLASKPLLQYLVSPHEPNALGAWNVSLADYINS